MRDILENRRSSRKSRQRHCEAEVEDMLKRVIGTVIFLRKQELAFRDHRESLANDSSVNTGNVLEELKYVANYDGVISNHFDK